MILSPEMLEALAGLPPMPRTPLTINPCPEGYNLQLVGGQFMCILESVSGTDILEQQRMQMMRGPSPRTGSTTPGADFGEFGGGGGAPGAP